jgi:hypothetical protein
MAYFAPQLVLIGHAAGVVLGTNVSSKYDNAFQLCSQPGADNPDTATDSCSGSEDEW